MFRFIRSSRLGAICAISTTFIAAVTAKGAGFQPNDVVVFRAVNTSSTAATVELDEYSSTGLQSSPLNVVSISSSGNNVLTISKNDPFEGALKLSGDSNYLTLAGFGINASSTVVGRVNVGDRTVDLSTKINKTSTLFGAVTSNGTDIWLKGISGVGYTTLSSSTATTVSQPYTPGGTVGIFGGQLYTTLENSTLNMFASVGNGLPKVSSSETPLPGLITTDYDHHTNDFWFRDANTLYLAESNSFDVHAGVQKWAFNGTAWQYQYNVFTSEATYLSGWVDPGGNTVLFATYTTYGTTENNLLRIVDGGSQALSNSSVLATAALGTSFRGVAFISAPEPASIVLIALGALGVFVVVRRCGIATARIAAVALCALSATLVTVTAQGAGFQPGHIVTLQTQSGSYPQAVQLDEYNVVGSQSSPLSTLAIPSTGVNKLTGPTGPVKLSSDSNYLTFGGYDLIPGAPNTLSTPWVVGRVTVGDGTIDLSTKITNIAGISTSQPILRNAVSSNGSDIWVAGYFGVGYTTLGSSTLTRVNQSIEKNTVGIFGGQLYTSGGITSGVTPPYLIGTVGDGLPKTPTTKEATLPGIPPTNDANATDFWFRDANSLYLNVQTSGTPNPGIQKWTFNGTAWQYQYNLPISGLAYLSGWVDPNGNTVLFAQTGTSILRIVDGGSQALSKPSVLATAPTGTSFFGVAFISAPEPASFVLMALGALGAFVVARRRRIVTRKV